MQALLLAAGRSRRFYPLSDKNFLQLGPRSLIEYQVAALTKAGVRKLIIVGNKYNLRRLKRLFPRTIILQQKKLGEGMAGAVLTAKEYLESPSLILSTNDIFDPSVIKKVMGTKKCDGAILSRLVNEYFPGGYLELDKHGRITSIVEKPKPGTEPSHLINIVCHYYRKPRDLIAELETILKKRKGWLTDKGQTDDIYEQALGKLVKSQKILAVEYRGVWQAVKYPWHVLAASQYFLKSLRKKRAKSAEIAKSAVISGPVVIEEGVKIFDHAVVIGPVYLGKNSVVGTGSLVRESIIGEGSVVGSGSELARSHLGSGSWLHRNYVGDSVLGDNVSLGSGVVIGNLRLDEEEVRVRIGDQTIKTGGNKLGAIIGDNCRIGANTSLMPGVLIGEGSFISSGLLINQNIPEKSFVKGKVDLEIKVNKKTIFRREKPR